MKDTILQIAARELGTKDFLFSDTRIDDVFDSLDFVHFLMCLKEEIGPICTADALKAETFGDIARLYDKAAN
jgi:acyl carrier protein